MSADPPLRSPALLQALTAATARACTAIMQMRRAGANVRLKADGSPVTAADEAADAIIGEALEKLLPGLPVISEESFAAGRCADISGGVFALIDPLDGTREFIAGRDAFTTNIALLADNRPVLGVIGAPASGRIWRGTTGGGADRLSIGADGVSVSAPEPVRVRAAQAGDVTAVVSRSHLDADTVAFLDARGIAKRVAAGSSLKFCRLAQGEADIYPRLAPINEWDIAAGHAILEAAGGIILTEDGSSPRYGRLDRDLRVPSFIAYGDRTLAAAR
ncbi:MAG: 3'(2'),5'-bisphosphate nucleotidase CysQ [Pseudorhodoplanes sp.]